MPPRTIIGATVTAVLVALAVWALARLPSMRGAGLTATQRWLLALGAAVILVPLGYNRCMTTARRLALVLVVYLAADFVDASAPGVFFFDSALFLGTVVQSKARSADAADHAQDACAVVDDGLPTVAGEDRPIPGVSRVSVLVTTCAPLARNATSTSDPPPAAEDH